MLKQFGVPFEAGCRCVLAACLFCCKQLQLCAWRIVNCLPRARLTGSEVCSLGWSVV